MSVKVTERTLVDMCRRVNNERLKQWDSGLKVERRANEYVVQGSQGLLMFSAGILSWQNFH